MKNAVIYARFSSHAQNEQSIEGQLKECRAFAERNNLRIVREYIDRALTGTTDKRPDFLQMIEDSKRKGFQFVIVYQLDRFARNRYDSATFIRFLNERGIKTSQGGLWNKSSFHRIFSNRRYLGKYIYHGEEIDGGMPQLIDDELFAEAQKVLAKYAAAPSRGKAKVEYLLSDKMICGHCGNKMTGISSTSKSKKIHHYYKCTGNNKGICKKRTVRKQFIEDEVVAAIVGEHGILTDEFIDLVAAETYLLIQAEQNDTEIKRLENLIAENQKAINNLMQALMLGKIADTILSQIEKLENENKELQDTIANEKAMQINYSYADIRKWLSHFRTLDYSKTKNRKDLIDTFIYRVILYNDKMKVLFHLKGGQQGELLLNLIFPDYPDGYGDDGENVQKMPENEKETDKSVSNSDVNAECAYTSRLVDLQRVALWSYGVCASFLHT